MRKGKSMAPDIGFDERLERALTPLYPSSGAVDRLVKNAKLDASKIKTDAGAPNEVMFRTVEVAGSRNRRDLIEAAIRYHPEDQALLGLRDELDISTQTNTRLHDAIEQLQSTRRRLRRRGHLDTDALTEVDELLARIDELLDVVQLDDSQSKVLVLSPLVKLCFGSLDIYSDLLVEDASISIGNRPPGSRQSKRPLSEIAEDRLTLLDAKQQLEDAVAQLLLKNKALWN